MFGFGFFGWTGIKQFCEDFMAKTQKVELKAEVRDTVGSKQAVRLRKAGKIPAIVYGHGQEPVAIAVDRHDLTEALHHGHRIFDTSIGKKKETLLVKDLQYDYLGKDIVHADMVRVDLGEMVKVTVPIEQRGTSKGSHEAGIIDELLDHIEIECKAGEIPEMIEVLIKEVGVGDSVHAGDIPLPAGVKLVTDPRALVLHCHLVAAAKTTEEIEEEAPAAPEVIGEKPEEGEAKEPASE